MSGKKRSRKRIKSNLRQQKYESLKKLEYTSSTSESEDGAPALQKYQDSISNASVSNVEDGEVGGNSEVTMSLSSDDEMKVCGNHPLKETCSDSIIDSDKSQVHCASPSVDDIDDVSSECSSDCSSEYSDEEIFDSDEEISHDEITDNSSFSDKLRLWALKCKIRHTKLTELLKLLQPHFPELPKTAKTFLQHNLKSQYKVEKFMPYDESDTSEYVYFGIEEHLKKTVNPDLHLKDMIIFLKFFFDGLPLYTSSPIQFWPLLCKVFCKSYDVYKPFNVATWCGEGKPKSVDSYFAKFIDELNRLLKDGIVIENKKFQVKCKCWICDRPARAYIKQTQGHAGFYACERCHFKALKQGGMTVFPTACGEKRTDKTFRQKAHLEHHQDISPLGRIYPPMDMVKSFVIESMHAGPLGNMKRLLIKMWIGGQKKMSKVNALRLSVRMTNLSRQIPCEFQRKTRSLGSIKYWTANEYDFFLKYCGPMVLDGLLDDHLFEHFLLFHVSFRIISCPKLHKTHLNFARSYLDSFVKLAELPNYYSFMMSTINMHDLLHLPDDVEEMDCDITKYAAFPFENDLGVTKRDIRSGNKPLSQLCRRRAENDLLLERPSIPPTYCILKTAKRNDKEMITKLRCRGFEIGSSYPNNIVLLEDGNFMRISQMSEDPEEKGMKNYFIKGTIFVKKCPAFSFPPKTFEVLNIFLVEENLTTIQEKVSVRSIKSKCALFQIYDLDEEEKKMFVVPMLHE